MSHHLEVKNKIELVILDRDGVINFDSPYYIKSPEEWEAIPGSLQAIKKLNEAGIKVAIATNQSGIGRGYYSLQTLQKIHAKMLHQLKAIQAFVDHIEYCPHHPDDQCECRKPKPGMLIKILTLFQVDKDNALMIGDSQRDIDAATNAGVSSINIGKDFDNLLDAVNALLSK